MICEGFVFLGETWAFSSQWTCCITDRKTGISYYGSDSTKKGAKDNAWDDVWTSRRGYDDSSSETSSPPSDIVQFTLAGVGIGLFLSIFSSVYKGCGVFHYNPRTDERPFFFDASLAFDGFFTLPIALGVIGLLLGIVFGKLK
jgi:hypothetical protein